MSQEIDPESELAFRANERERLADYYSAHKCERRIYFRNYYQKMKLNIASGRKSRKIYHKDPMAILQTDRTDIFCDLLHVAPKVLAGYILSLRATNDPGRGAIAI